MTRYTGPGKINCLEQCDVPDGVTIAVVPAPRHNWDDVKVCPNEGCGLAFLVLIDEPQDRPEEKYGDELMREADLRWAEKGL